MNTVYGQLYDIVERRMAAQQKKMPCSKNAFLYTTKAELGKCSVAEMQGLSNSECVEVAYLGIFGRLPEMGAKKAYECYEQQEKSIFLSNLLYTLINSEEAIIKNGIVVENKGALIDYLNQELQQDKLNTNKENEVTTSTEGGVKDKLYNVYIKMPLPLRKLARKLLRRDKM